MTFEQYVTAGRKISTINQYKVGADESNGDVNQSWCHSVLMENNIVKTFKPLELEDRQVLGLLCKRTETFSVKNYNYPS
jgi:hypothetical protein